VRRLSELATADAPVLLASPTGPAEELRLGDLLPRSFSL
jgi:cytidine deaminase